MPEKMIVGVTRSRIEMNKRKNSNAQNIHRNQVKVNAANGAPGRKRGQAKCEVSSHAVQWADLQAPADQWPAGNERGNPAKVVDGTDEGPL